MATRYERETGRKFDRWPQMPDVLLAVARFRRAPRWSASHHYHYMPTRERAMRPVLGQLRMIEAAIRCDVACRGAVTAWRAAA